MLLAPLAMPARWVGIPLTAPAVNDASASAIPMPMSSSGAQMRA
jgi:hypothetical protein